MSKSTMSKIVCGAFAVLCCICVAQAADGKPVKVLIVTGDHGHDWRKTTPFLKEVLTKAGHEVEVTERPRLDLISVNLKKYDVLLLNYRNTPKGAKDNPNSVWSDDNKNAFTEAVKGGKGKADAKDPIDRESSEIQAVACFFPPTDFLNYGGPGEDAVGVGTLKGFKSGFGPRSDTVEGRQELGREISPIYFIQSNTPPILIVHGDADKLVPIYQAEQFVKRCQEAGVKAKLVVREGKAHGWAGIEKDLPLFADWFDEQLRGMKPAAVGSQSP